MTLTQKTLLVAILAITFFIYLPAAGGPYQSDDYPNLLQNDKLLLDEVNLATIREAAFSSRSSQFGRPVSMLSFTANYTIAGNKDPYSVKLTNIIIHLITGLALFSLSMILLSHLLASSDSDKKLIFPVSLFVTAFWLLHPLFVSTVLYAVQRMTMLSALFTVIGLIAYIKLRQRTLETGRSFLSLVLSMTGFTTLAFFSKENGALLPVFALLVEICVFRFRYGNNTSGLIKVIHKLSLFLPALFIISFLTYKFFTLTGEIVALHNFTPEERLISQPRAIMNYLGWLMLLNPRPMTLYHLDFEISTGFLSPPTTIISLLCILFLLVTCAVSIKKRKQLILGFGLAWFFAGHLIESTTIPLILMYEHRNYLPGYGILLILSFYFLKIIHERFYTQKNLLMFSLILFLPLLLTWERAQSWVDEKSIVLHMIKNQPDFSWTWEETALFFSKTGDYEEAYKAARRAQELAPEEPTHIFTEAFLRCRHEPGEKLPDDLVSSLLSIMNTDEFKPNDLDRYVNMINTCFHSGLNHASLKEIFTTGLKNSNPSVRKRSRDALSVYP